MASADTDHIVALHFGGLVMFPQLDVRQRLALDELRPGGSSVLVAESGKTCRSSRLRSIVSGVFNTDR